MDWHSRRITGILEHALLEDKATSDATSRACIDPQQRATATILAKQDCILAGAGAIGFADMLTALDSRTDDNRQLGTVLAAGGLAL